MQPDQEPHPFSAYRSTSPPKSAWPGVSTTLSVWPLYWNEVYLLEMVMPLQAAMVVKACLRCERPSVCNHLGSFNFVSLYLPHKLQENSSYQAFTDNKAPASQTTRNTHLSLSNSFESMTRSSVTASPPPLVKSLSTRVVLP